MRVPRVVVEVTGLTDIDGSKVEAEMAAAGFAAEPVAWLGRIQPADHQPSRIERLMVTSLEMQSRILCCPRLLRETGAGFLPRGMRSRSPWATGLASERLLKAAEFCTAPLPAIVSASVDR